MGVHSQNGWPAYPDTSRFTRFTAAGQGWWAANADVAVVFTEFIERFDREVEEITQKTLDDWSYANRLVRGSTSVVSNHGSATAIDLNALKHPRGRHDTFTAAQQRTMHRIRDDITDNAGRPVLRLGLDYTDTVDDMHVEIDANEARVKQAADKIRKAKEDDVTTAAELWDDQVTLTAKDAQIWGGGRKEGDKVSLSEMIRYPTLARKIDAKLTAYIAQSAAREAATLAAIQALAGGAGIDQGALNAAALAGARQALAELGDALDGSQ